MDERKLERGKHWYQVRPTEDHYFTPDGFRIPNIVLRLYQGDNKPRTVAIHSKADPATSDSWRLIQYDAPGRPVVPDDFAERGRRKTRYRYLVRSRCGFILCELDRTVPSGHVREMMARGHVFVRPVSITQEKPERATPAPSGRTSVPSETLF